jgi:NAD(P)-dependent dehydrogenase (short-subunit alcohol dehydrogenase family)
MTNVVIGAGSGMGAATARLLARRGRLIAADRNLEAVEKLAADIGGDVVPLACDVTDQAQIDAVVAEIGELDAIVHAAGISGSMGTGRQILEVNLRGMARMLASVEPLLRPGSVGVLFASMSGHRVPQHQQLNDILDDPLADDFFDAIAGIGIDLDMGHGSYPASKLGVQRMARRLAPAWGAKGARILSVSPGINDTPMNRLDEERNPIMLDFIAAGPLGRRGTPAEVASVVEFLTSDGASFMTGTDILVDGGMVAVIPEDSTGGAIKAS